MKKLKQTLRRVLKRQRYVVFLLVAALLFGSGAMVASSLPGPISGSMQYNVNYPADLRTKYADSVHKVRLFEDKQSKMKVVVASDKQLQNMISQIQLDAASEHFADAYKDIKTLGAALDNWNLEIEGGQTAATNVAGGTFLPIVLYHYTPGNFEQQLAHLEQHGYTAIDLDQALVGLHGGPLPAKPVVITFDDGFSNQMQAFDLLKKHHMKATFYIINAGERSKWCIGAGRRYGDPLQPPGGCGDAYLTWDQVRELDQSGLIAIGGHTLDHENLAALPAGLQRLEILDSKAGIEKEIGHPIRHFAYPYGAYNATSISLAHEAGYLTAVTTLPGDFQPPGSEFTLRRIRDTLSLP